MRHVFRYALSMCMAVRPFWGCGKRGTVVILVYLVLGAAGLPVFAGFRGGVGALIGVTGGYLTGFFVCCLVYWLLTALFPKQELPAMAAGLAVCYCFGNLWYYNVYINGGGAVTVGYIIIKCILPYLVPDIIKLLLARQLSQKLKRFVY